MDYLRKESKTVEEFSFTTLFGNKANIYKNYEILTGKMGNFLQQKCVREG